MKQYTCIVCPNSCLISVDEKDGEILISGNQCKRGKEFAESEYTHPVRMFTSTVKIDGARLPRIPVVSSGEIPKEKLFECQDALKKACISAPVKLGDVVIKNICDTGIDMVATRTLNSCK